MGILLLLSMRSGSHIFKISTFYFEDKSLSQLKAALPLARQEGGHQHFSPSRNTSWAASPLSQAVIKFRDVHCLVLNIVLMEKPMLPRSTSYQKSFLFAGTYTAVLTLNLVCAAKLPGKC